MKKILLFLLVVGAMAFTAVQATQELKKVEANKMTAMDVYEQMSFLLAGSWSLSPKEEQLETTGAHESKAIAHLVGDTKAIGTKYKLIGKGATLEEVLLPNTAKSMVTMYHCNSFKNCTELKATHYCAKQNQPEFLLNLEETRKNKFVFDCDMSTELCNSDEDHIHKMIFELSEEDSHLKASYLAWENKKLRKKHSIYHFDRM